MSGDDVDIGFLEVKPEWLLHPRFFPSKIGGKPAWLDLKDILSPTALACKKCTDPLIFLCQVYAPYEDSEVGFHRSIFIFICKNGSCCQPNNAENFVVLRCQLPRKNEFYSFEPYEEKENEEFPMDKWPKLCEICGVRAPSHCSKCKKIYYCCRKHQVLDWQKGHKEKCPSIMESKRVKLSNFTVTEAGKSLLFKEWELIVDAEDKEEVKDADVNQEMEKLHKLVQEKKGGSLCDVDESELEQYARKPPEDKVFNKFSKRIARHPDQVLRYDRGGSPLWITGNTSSVVNVPNCEHCNQERQFEFQIMPQLLNFINVGVDISSIDWGVLAVYTCKASCVGGDTYKHEYLVKQDIVQ